MLRVRVLIPFHRRETDTDQVPGDEILVSEEELARIRSVNINMVDVIGKAEEPAPEKPEQEPAPDTMPKPVPEPAPEKPKKKTKKQ